MSPSVLLVFFFLMIRRPPRSTLDRSSAASDVYKRQGLQQAISAFLARGTEVVAFDKQHLQQGLALGIEPVSYTHLRAHETVLDLVCRLLLEKKKSSLLKQRT